MKVKPKKTKISELIFLKKEKKERLQQANVNLRGILFNDIPVQSRQYGAGKYHYEYVYEERG